MSFEELFFLAEAFRKTDSLLSFSHDRDFVEGPGNDLFTAAVWESGHQHFSASWIGHDGHLLLDFLTWLQEDNSGREGGKRNVIFSNFASSNNTQRYGFWLKGAISKISDVPQQRMVIIFLHLCGWWVWNIMNYLANPHLLLFPVLSQTKKMPKWFHCCCWSMILYYFFIEGFC